MRCRVPGDRWPWARALPELVASDATGSTRFGISVSRSRDTTVVGAGDDDNAAGVDAGAAHACARTGVAWRGQRKLVALGESAPPIPFLALRRQAILIVRPDPDDVEQHAALQPGTYDRDRARVRCLFADASVEGTIQLLAGLRVSDFLETCPGFIGLADCSLTSEQGPPETGIRHVIVNTAHLLAVAELSKPESAAARVLLEPVGASKG